jgi:hypothetical protein
MSDAAEATRASLHRVAVHVLARRRAEVSGRIGLRATPGGFGTPSFGPPDAPEVLRVAGTTLVHESGGDVRATPIGGATLRHLAAFAGADLDGALDVGHDTPPLGDPDDVLLLDGAAAADVAGWFDLGWRVLDRVVAVAAAPTAIQLWPEHLDAGCSVATGPGADDRCNLGASPGDGGVPEPYLYVGPWGSARPGPDDGFWNAPFGAVRRARDLGPDPVAAGVAFLLAGLDRLR